MEIGANIKVEIEDNTGDVLKNMDKGVEAALTQMGLLCMDYATNLCPVHMGRLKNSITKDVHMNEKAVYVGTNVEYAPYVRCRIRSQAGSREVCSGYRKKARQCQRTRKTLLKACRNGA